MKLNKLTTLVAVVMAAALFAGCKFAGTTTSFKDTEANAYLVANDHANFAGKIIKGDNDANAGAQQEFTFYIVSKSSIDSKVIDEACTFNIATANEVAGYYPTFTALAKTLKEIDFRSKGKNSSQLPEGVWGFSSGYFSGIYNDESLFVTKVVYSVDTIDAVAPLDTDTVALVVDGTKLKEKTGKFVLNNDGNDKCGEASDGLIIYYSGIKDKDGVAFAKTVDLTAFTNKNFAPTLNLSIASAGLNKDDDEEKQRYVVNIDAPSYWDGTNTVYAEDFAGQLQKMYSISTLPLGAKKWTTGTLTFEYIPLPYPHYRGKSEFVELGTQCYLVEAIENKFTWEATAPKYGGVAERLGYSKDRKKYSNHTTCNYYDTDEKGYILVAPDNRETVTTLAYADRTNKAFSYNTISGVQKDILGVEALSDGVIKIYVKAAAFGNDIRLGETKGFKVLSVHSGAAGNVLESTVSSTVSDDKGITTVYLQLKNKNYKFSDSTAKVFVGPETTISGNKLYENQTKFGWIGSRINGSIADALPGYVCLN